ncbi:MAG: hypothetical protein ACR2KZ_01375 [Segetibacter sp.]
MKFKGGDRFYDDNQWIGITSMDAYTRLKNKKFLNLGKEIYKYMMTGYDTVLVIGLYWPNTTTLVLYQAHTTCTIAFLPISAAAT